MARGKLDADDPLRVMLPKQSRTMKIVGVVTVQGLSAVASGDLLLAAPSTVQQAAGLPAGTWQSVWVKSAGVPPKKLRGDLARDLGQDVTVRTAAGVRHAQSADLQGAGAAIGGAIGMLASVAVFVACSSSPTRSARSSGSGPGGSRCSARSGRRPARSNA